MHRLNEIEKRVSIFAIAFQLRFGLATEKAEAKQKGSKLNGTHHLLVYAKDINLSRSLWCLFSEDKQISLRARQRAGLT
jgi:hypothetical protein